MRKNHRQPPSWSSRSSPSTEGFTVEIEIAAAVDTLRFNRNWSQEKLAREVGTSQSAIARLESGLSTPSLHLLKRVARAFGKILHIDFLDIPHF